ncbi:MAG TPA: MBL fold metallo-hydrolase [Firmicutes bacterium]|nr:MBL fold metallo-hydrolase [Bacillota bacterium]
MEIQWYGHSCFRLVDRNGFAIVTDPFDDSVGYPRPTASASLVTLSHDHYDHNRYQLIGGAPKVVNRPGTVAPGELPPGVSLRGVAAFHDEVRGRRRGPNTIFLFELDGVRVAHLGDLGHQLTPEQLAALTPLDVLLVPVGGTYTIDARGAYDLCQAVNPKIAIPMHYKTDVCRVDVAPVEPFLRLCPQVERPGTSRLTLTAEALSGLRPWKAVVLNYR